MHAYITGAAILICAAGLWMHLRKPGLKKCKVHGLSTEKSCTIGKNAKFLTIFFIFTLT
jgi:hypothetical protein